MAVPIEEEEEEEEEGEEKGEGEVEESAPSFATGVGKVIVGEEGDP